MVRALVLEPCPEEFRCDAAAVAPKHEAPLSRITRTGPKACPGGGVGGLLGGVVGVFDGLVDAAAVGDLVTVLLRPGPDLCRLRVPTGG
jgi:hypothetical protein